MPSVQKTPNLGLNKWQGNEYAKRADFVDDNQKIDAAIGNIETLKTVEKTNVVGAINEVKDNLDTKKLDSNTVTVVDTANNFTADLHGKKLLEDVLVQINTNIQANSTEINGQREKAIYLHNRLDEVF